MSTRRDRTPSSPGSSHLQQRPVRQRRPTLKGLIAEEIAMSGGSAVVTAIGGVGGGDLPPLPRGSSLDFYEHPRASTPIKVNQPVSKLHLSFGSSIMTPKRFSSDDVDMAAQMLSRGNSFSSTDAPSPTHMDHPFPTDLGPPKHDKDNWKGYKNVKKLLIEHWHNVNALPSSRDGEVAASSPSSPKLGRIIGLLRRSSSNLNLDEQSPEEDSGPLSIIPLPKAPPDRVWDPPVKDKRLPRALKIAGNVLEQVTNDFETPTATTLSDYVAMKPAAAKVNFKAQRKEEKEYLKEHKLYGHKEIKQTELPDNLKDMTMKKQLDDLLAKNHMDLENIARDLKRKETFADIEPHAYDIAWATKYYDHTKNRIHEQDRMYQDWLRKLKKEHSAMPGQFHPPYGEAVPEGDGSEGEEDEDLETWTEQAQAEYTEALDRFNTLYKRSSSGAMSTLSLVSTSTLPLPLRVPRVREDPSSTQLIRRHTDWEAELRANLDKESERQKVQERRRSERTTEMLEHLKASGEASLGRRRRRNRIDV